MRHNEKLAPVVLFVYNRIEHTKQTIEALKKNRLAKETNLFIFSDGPKQNEISKNEVHEVREFIKKIDGFKKITIIENKRNKGLANSVIEGVTQIVKKYEHVIVLEDDLISSENFLEYMNSCLKTYKYRKDICSISGYSPPIKIPKNYREEIFLSYRASSWGYATWLDRWEKVDWEVNDYKDFIVDKKKIQKFNLGGQDMTEMLNQQMNKKIDSWAIRWCYHHFKENSYCIYPIKSKIKNIGFDGSGTHCGLSKIKEIELDTRKNKLDLNSEISLNEQLVKNFRKNFDLNFKAKIFFYFKNIKCFLKKLVINS